MQNDFLPAEKPVFEAIEIICSVKPILFNEGKCIGCNSCATVCQVDILIPNEEKGKPPVVLYPGECYYCGSCVMACPVEGAITLRHPIMNRTKFVEVSSPRSQNGKGI